MEAWGTLSWRWVIIKSVVWWASSVEGPVCFDETWASHDHNAVITPHFVGPYVLPSLPLHTFTHTYTHPHEHAHMGVGWQYVSLWCDVLHFHPYRLPAVLHTHACAGRWANDECESMSCHWCRSWPHQHIRLCPLDRDSYSGSHHQVLTGLTISLVTQDLHFDSEWVLWEKKEAL